MNDHITIFQHEYNCNVQKLVLWDHLKSYDNGLFLNSCIRSLWMEKHQVRVKWKILWSNSGPCSWTRVMTDGCTEASSRN